MDVSAFEDGEDGEIAAAADVEAEEEVLFEDAEGTGLTAVGEGEGGGKRVFAGEAGGVEAVGEEERRLPPPPPTLWRGSGAGPVRRERSLSR